VTEAVATEAVATEAVATEARVVLMEAALEGTMEAAGAGGSLALEWTAAPDR
jgi:hypothetical protein